MCNVAFKQLLDNYETVTGVAETVSAQEEQENWNFIDLVAETQVMREAHRFLVAKGKSSPEPEAFKRLLYKLWFKIYKRTREDE